MCTVEKTADFFLSIPDDDASNAISPMKLQKLLYYAQGFALATLNKPLFNEDFEAWDYGPVIPLIYQKYKEYGNKAIPHVDLPSFDAYTKEEKELLDNIYDAFGQYSAWALSELTHATPPWKNTPRNGIITKESMRAFFATQVVQ